jgi:hypothetical protein
VLPPGLLPRGLWNPQKVRELPCTRISFFASFLLPAAARTADWSAIRAGQTRHSPNPLRREPMAGCYPTLCRLSYNDLRSLAGFEPATLWLLVCRSIPRLHHAANSSNLCRSSLVACRSLSFRERQQRVAANAGAIGPCPSDEKFREESALTVVSGIEPEALRPFRRSNRELHHPGTLIPRRISLDRNDLGGDFTVARISRPRDPIALASFRLGFCRVSYLLSRSVRIPANRDVRLRYLQSN